MIDHFLRDASGVLSCPFWSAVLPCGARLPIHIHLKPLDRAVSGARFLTGVVWVCHCSSIVDLLQFCVFCIRSCVTRCIRLLMSYLDCVCQCGLHAVNWSHIGILMLRFAAEPRSTAGLLFLSQCPSGTILLTPYSMVWDWRVWRAGQCFFIGLSCSIPTIVFYYFSLLFFLSKGWHCGAGVFRLIGWISLSLSLALPNYFNNNNNNNNISMLINIIYKYYTYYYIMYLLV